MLFTHSCQVETWPGLYERPVVERFEMMTQLAHGEPVSIHDTEGLWTKITAAHYPQHQGWVKTAALRQGVCDVATWLESFVETTHHSALNEALGYLGTPYLWGGMSTLGIDCSGLVHVAYRNRGRMIPRDSRDLEEAGSPIEFDELRPGDLITYFPANDPDSQYPRHIAFWVGGGKILHAIFRDDVKAVVLEPEPESLRAQRRRAVSFER